MKTPFHFWRLIRSFGRKRAVKQEIDEELRFHIEQRTAEYIAEGMSPEEAARTARKRFGNVQNVREECCAVCGASLVETTLKDLCFGARMLRKNPGFTSIVLLTFALGVGATSSVFSLIRGVLLTPPPYPGPDQIVLISSARIHGEPYAKGIANAQWLEWKNEAKSFAAMAGYGWGFDFLVFDDRSETLEGLFVTPDYFTVIGVRPQIGREFLSSDAPTAKTKATVVILGHELWQRQFHGDPNILGKVIHLTRRPPLTAEPEVYLSFWQFPAWTKSLLVRTTADPRAVMAGVRRELRALDPTVVIENVRTLEQIRDDSIAPQLFAMRLLAGFSVVASALALIGIYGVLSLSVASRRREMAIRIAIGAQRRNVLGLVLGQGLKLVGVGVAIGTGVALASTGLLRAFLFGVGPTNLPTFAAMALLFMAAASLACYLPARRAARTDPMTALRYE